MNSVFKKFGLLIFMGILSLLILLFFVFRPKKFDDSSISINYLNGSQELVVSNSLPMTDVVGKSISLNNYKLGTTGYLEFEIKSNVEDRIKYEIYLTKLERQIEVPVKFVKVYLTDENNNPLEYFEESKIPTYYDLRLSDSDPSGKLIYSGYLKKNSSKKFVLRMWVADTYELTPEEIRFEAKLNVKIK